MTDPGPQESPLSQRQRRKERTRRRRRLALTVIPVIVLLALALVLLVNKKDSDEQRTSTKAGTTDRSADTGPTTNPTTSRASVPSSAKQSTTATPTTTAAPGSTEPVALLRANLKEPPDPPIGYYRRGKLYLEGSVRTEATAAGYLRKARAVLGASNVVMNMKRDPRVPRGPVRVIVEEQFQFPTGSSALDPKFAGLLAVGATALKLIPESTLVITGYTDNVGSAQVNQSLSEQRAQLVVDFMVKRGIPQDRIVAIGRGEADPIATNSTAAGRQKNRRIEGTLEGINP